MCVCASARARAGGGNDNDDDDDDDDDDYDGDDDDDGDYDGDDDDDYGDDDDDDDDDYKNVTLCLSRPLGPMTLSKMCLPTWESTALRGSSKKKMSLSLYTALARLTLCF